MSLVRHSRSCAPSAPRSGAFAAAALTTIALLALSGCGASGAGPEKDADARVGSVSGATAPAGESARAATAAVRISANVRRSDVPVDKVVTVAATGGRLRSVAVRAAKGVRIPGEVSPDGTRWTASRLLEPGTTYTITTSAVDSEGRTTTTRQRFATKKLTLDEQTYPSVAPLNGETVGVGMPVIVNFDVAVKDKAAFEKHMHVTATPAQGGSWYWVSDHEAHWRPKTYWKAGSEVSVKVDVNSVAAGNGVYGQEDRDLHFHVGDAHIYKVDTRTDEMKVFSNGRLLRTIPVTTGKPGFTTRSGVKVIIEKFPVKRMRSETIGIGRNSPDYYDLDDVQWAMRLTYSGEFLHAAPWSVADQGRDNVSHGCTGMSTANADWLYHMTRRGDVVVTTGTDRQMEFGNGYGDWNMSWSDYRQGSALA